MDSIKDEFNTNFLLNIDPSHMNISATSIEMKILEKIDTFIIEQQMNKFGNKVDFIRGAREDDIISPFNAFLKTKNRIIATQEVQDRLDKSVVQVDNKPVTYKEWRENNNIEQTITVTQEQFNNIVTAHKIAMKILAQPQKEEEPVSNNQAPIILQEEPSQLKQKHVEHYKYKGSNLIFSEKLKEIIEKIKSYNEKVRKEMSILKVDADKELMRTEQDKARDRTHKAQGRE